MGCGGGGVGLLVCVLLRGDCSGLLLHTSDAGRDNVLLLPAAGRDERHRPSAQLWCGGRRGPAFLHAATLPPG
jgi:hypothetical protein